MIFRVLATAIALTFLPGHADATHHAVAHSATVNVEPTPSPPSPPIIAFRAIPAENAVDRSDEVVIYFLVQNKSSKSLHDLQMSIFSDIFDKPGAIRLSAPIGPFAAAESQAKVKVSETAVFGEHRVLLTVAFSWSEAKRDFLSMESATIGMRVKRKFEDESSGLPGGTAALVYLLLPIIPAFFSFQCLETLRKHQPLRIPNFSQEYIVPAFFVALIASYILLAVHRSVDVAYSDSRSLGIVLGASAAMGAVIPILRWITDKWRSCRWEFSEDDSAGEYLRKALLAPRAPKEYTWATVRIGGTERSGIMLKQPGGELVLGARVQIGAESEENLKYLQTRFVDGAVLRDRKGLVRLVKKGANVRRQENITRAGEPLEGVWVAVTGGTQYETVQQATKDLVEFVT